MSKLNFLHFSTTAILLWSFSTTAQANVTWEQVLTCNNGEASIQVDTGERRNIRLQITNARVVNYLKELGYGELFFNRITSSGGLSAVGRVRDGIFQRNQFSYVNFPACHEGGCTSYFLEAYVSGPLLVVGLKDLRSRTECVGGSSSRDEWGNCTEGSEYIPAPGQLRNWVFRNCR